MGLKPQISVHIKLPNLSTMPRPSTIRNVQNLSIIIFSHISLEVAIISLILYPHFLETVKSTLENFKSAVINLALWLHRAESKYPYNLKKDISLQTRVRKLQKEENPPSWTYRLRKSFRMWKKAVIGKDVENNDNENKPSQLRHKSTENSGKKLTPVETRVHLEQW